MTTNAAANPLAPTGKELRQLLARRLHDPHGVLGVHPVPGRPGTWVLRAFHPDAAGAEALLPDAVAVPMRLLHKSGLFAALLEGHAHPPTYRLRFRFADGAEFERGDPYRFLPTLGDLDLHLIGEGSHQKLWEVLGAHLRVVDGVAGVAFAVWAPNASRVSVVGDFNAWDGRLYPMRPLGGSGVWELFVPDLAEWAIYRYEIAARDGSLRLKTDPLAFALELRPKTAGLVFDHERYAWSDGDWMEARAGRDLRQEPLAVYEVHLGSWMRAEGESGEWLTYREIAPRLVEHVRRLGFTHVELLPVAEHPFDPSWGYQVTGFFAPTSRFGTPDDFKFFVDTLHQAGIGVILDWVPGHFPRDDYSLRRFDGTALYEHEDPRLGEHPDWGTLIFNFGRNEVRNFLHRQRAVLAGGLPHRRPARRRRGLDALPRLQPQGGRVDPQPLRRPREPRGGRLPAPAQRAGLRPAPGVLHDRRGVDGLAGGLAAGVARRARLRLQVEHGLDARHAALLRPRPRAPRPPPQRADLLDALRLHRELRAAALARRGRPRQGLAARQDARATAGRSSPTCAC